MQFSVFESDSKQIILDICLPWRTWTVSSLRQNLGYVHVACICPGLAAPIALGEIRLLRVFLLPISDPGRTDRPEGSLEKSCDPGRQTRVTTELEEYLVVAQQMS